MKIKKIKYICVTILIILFTLNSCSMFNNDDEEIQLLEEQIAKLETQNALITEKSNEAIEEKQQYTPTSEESQQEEMESITEDLLPTSPVQAGVPIVYDGWSMTVSQELTIHSSDNYWGITIYIRNLGDTNRIFRFTNSGVTAKDNLGNVYEMANPGMGSIAGNDGLTCEESHYIVKNLEVEAGESEEINSARGGYHRCAKSDGIHMFEGPIPIDVSELIIHFEDFGPYSGIDVVIEL